MNDLELKRQLYELQRVYSAEHFQLQQAMRDLATERRRNAGAYAGVDILLQRAKALQARIAELKTRLQQYEKVEDLDSDSAPIAIGADATAILEGNRGGLDE